MTSNSRLLGRAALSVAALLLITALPALTFAATIDSETFDSYTGFDNSGDPKNPGVPNQAEGSDSPNWLAASLGPAFDGDIASDVGVQEVGYGTGNPGTPNLTPTGYTRDKRGLVMRLDLTNYENVLLDFEWRKHFAENNDRFIAAYHVGDGLGVPNGTYDWFNDPLKGNGNQLTFNTWYAANFTEIANFGGQSPFPFQSLANPIPLPGGDVLYLVFWLNNVASSDADRNAELGKVENIVITGDFVIPEPATGVLLSLGLAAIASLGLCRRGK